MSVDVLLLSALQASMQQFMFELDMKPDTTMVLTSSLGNIQLVSSRLLQALLRSQQVAHAEQEPRLPSDAATERLAVCALQVDCSLPEESPYRQACGLRSGSATSLVSVVFSSHLAGVGGGRVPAGLAYYGLQAELSQLQVVFLYSFLQETITYLTTMLAMRPPTKDAALQPGDAPAASDQQPAPVGPTEPQRGAALQPLLLLLDVQMDAPVISIPRHSTRCELRQHGEGRGAPGWQGSADSIQAVRCAAMHSPQSIHPPLGIVQSGHHRAGPGSIPAGEPDPAPGQPDRPAGRGSCPALLRCAHERTPLKPPLGSMRSFLWLSSSCGTRVCCAGVGISVSAGGTRGEDIVQNDKGWQLSWRRPLQAELRRQVPLVSRTRRYSPSFQGSMSPPPPRSDPI